MIIFDVELLSGGIGNVRSATIIVWNVQFLRDALSTGILTVEICSGRKQIPTTINQRRPSGDSGITSEINLKSSPRDAI
jgi:hypothetical protein